MKHLAALHSAKNNLFKRRAGFRKAPDIYSAATPRFLVKDRPCGNSGFKSKGRLAEPHSRQGRVWGPLLSHGTQSQDEIQGWLFPIPSCSSAKPMVKHMSTGINQLCVREGLHS